MIELMNKHSLDGRNPNSYTGYFWTLGRYDRPWGPERPILRTVRYTSPAIPRGSCRVPGLRQEVRTGRCARFELRGNAMSAA